MNRRFFSLRVCLISFLLFTSFPSICFSQNTYSSSIKEVYELQEKCGKLSGEMFRKEYGNGIINTDDGQMISNYQNHYNKKLNKCFIIIFTEHYPKNKNTKETKETGVLLMKRLYDINEHKEYGFFSKFRNITHPSECYLLNKSCSSGREWSFLVKPYMEE